MSADDLHPMDVAHKLNTWFPWAKWDTSEQNQYRCVWAEFETGRVSIGGFVFDRSAASERVARARTWSAALQQAKRWAWKCINADRRGGAAREGG